MPPASAQAPPAAPADRSDLIAGLGIAGLLLPEAIAYAGIANLPPQAGLAGLFAGLLAYGALGSSRFAVVSATSSSAAFLAAAVASFPGDAALHIALASGLVLLTGLCFLIASAARLGNASGFIARPVLHGFSLGLAVVIAIKQFARMSGLHLDTSSVLSAALEIAGNWRQVHPASLAIGVTALLCLRLLAGLRRVPAALVVMALGAACDRLLPLHDWGVEEVGAIHLALPGAALPVLDPDQWLRLGELGAAMVLVLFAESYGTVRTLALRHGDRIAPNRDLAALGIANVISGLARGVPVGAGYSATSANEAAGAQSRRAGMVAAAAVFALLLFALPLIERTPEAVLAAIVLNAISNHLRPSDLAPYFAWRRDRFIALASFAVVLVLGVLDGLLAGIAASVFMMLRDLSAPKVSVLGRLGQGHDFVNVALHPEAHTREGLAILRPEAPLFFGNVEAMTQALLSHVTPATRAVVLSLEESPDLDATALEALREFARHLELRGTALQLARVKEPVRELLARARLPELPESCWSNWSVDDAVEVAALFPFSGFAPGPGPGAKPENGIS